MILERGPGFSASVRDLPKHLNLATLSHGFVGWMFSITGPMMIVLSVVEKGKLSQEIAISWIFIGLLVGSATSAILSLYYRQPLTAAFTIPGMALVGTALGHISFSEAIGAYWVTGGLLILIAASGTMRPLMEWFPLPITMAMVAGVFLPFGLHIITAWQIEPWISIPATLAFLAVSFAPRLARNFPPILGAILTGILAASLTGQAQGELFHLQLGRPLWISPAWSMAAITELSVPLLLTVVAVHNAQGTAVLRLAQYQPPLNTMTWACGIGTMVNAFFGCVPACITGPVTAIIAPPSAGPREGRYVAGLVVGTLWLFSALLSPLIVISGKVLPLTLINLLGGLALFSVLGNAFGEAFGGKHRFGALTCFLVTVSEVTIGNIGAPFWGLVAGVAASALLERKDFTRDPSTSSKDAG